jgi:ArsR family transcriptional regulator
MYAEGMAQSRNIPLTKRPISDERATSLSTAFSALSDPIRLRLFDLVRRAGETGVCSCDLVEPLDRSQPTISHHLKVLREAGLVDSRREGTWLWYFAVPDCLCDIQSFLP